MTDHNPPMPPAAPVPGGPGMPARHPDSNLVLILGILGLLVCQVLSPIAWIKGNSALREIRSNPGSFTGESEANIGRILGIIGTIVLVFAVVIVIFFFFLIVIGVMTSDDFSTTTV